MAIINGTNLGEMLIGTMLDDMIHGKNGDDTINGGDGNDQLFGDAGNDLLDGGIGNNLLNGGVGADELLEYEGQNTLLGGGGNDVIWAAGGGGTLKGESGDDVLINDGNCAAFGGSGNDTLFRDVRDFSDPGTKFLGESGNDVIGFYNADFSSLMSAGATVIDGGSGTDTLRLVGSIVDFTMIDDSRITGIEILDLAQAEVIVSPHFLIGFEGLFNAVTLSTTDVLHFSNSTNTLTIMGDSMDTVNLVGFTDTNIDRAVSGHNYSVYTGGGATVLVENDIGTVMTS